MKVGIITKHTIVTHRKDYLRELLMRLKKYTKDVLLDEYTSPVFQRKKGLEKSAILRRADLVIVLGGDGTLLKTAHYLSKKPTLIAGVNMGNLGFMTEFTPDSLFENLDTIFKEKFCIDERFLLRVTTYRNGKKTHTTLALNEAVINQGGFARLINLCVEVNKRRLVTYRADGLLISTPTGSTGHSLSAGGPIVHPKIPAIIITPLCPVKLSVRPIVIPNDRELAITLETAWRAEKKPIVLTIDGQTTYNLKRDDIIKIRQSSRTMRMIRMENHNYYHMLRSKLSWGE